MFGVIYCLSLALCVAGWYRIDAAKTGKAALLGVALMVAGLAVATLGMAHLRSDQHERCANAGGQTVKDLCIRGDFEVVST